MHSIFEAATIVVLTSLLVGNNGYKDFDGNAVFSEETDFTKLFPEWNMTAPEIISYMGYPVEIHTTTTSDGYIIEMHRIPSKSSKKPPILLQHGLLSSSNEYIINFPNQSLAYILSDAGFDVWLGNYRGNIYSNKHVNYSSNDQEYWDVRPTEALQDLSFEIDYILNETGYKQLYYVGYSLGSTGMFALLSHKPEYNSKIKYFIALAPVVNTRYMTGLFPVLCNFINQYGLPPSWHRQFPPNPIQLGNERAKACFGKKAAMCVSAFALQAGPVSDHINMTRVPLYVNHGTGGTSYGLLRLVCQIVSAKDILRDYDYGPQENMLLYKQIEPPVFNISHVTCPVFIYNSNGDFFSRPGDVKYISETIKNFQGSHAVEELKYSHFDFVLAINNKVLLHDKIVARLDEYELANKTVPTSG